MAEAKKKICIVGAGGSAKDVLCIVADSIAGTNVKLKDAACFMVDDAYYNETSINGIDVISQSDFEPSKYDVVVAIGDPHVRKDKVSRMPAETTYTSVIHPSVIISQWVEIGEGAIIAAGTILTCNIKIGKHVHLNLNSTITHDCEMGDFFTTAPGVNISGNCKFGNCVNMGTNAATRQRIEICDDVTIGMGGVVVKNIDEPGVYVGNPVRKLDK